MGVLELILISVGLAMDAFAVAVCKGLSMKKMSWKKAGIIAVYFGGFQALMPAIGFLLGTNFEAIVTSVDHWIAFVLLGIIGGKMIKESFSEINENHDDDTSFKTMFVLAFKVNVVLAVTSIGTITFILSIFGVKIGNKFGGKYERKAELAGGCILVLMGAKILLEHLGIL